MEITKIMIGVTLVYVAIGITLLAGSDAQIRDGAGYAVVISVAIIGIIFRAIHKKFEKVEPAK